VSGAGRSWRLSGTILYAADVVRCERKLEAIGFMPSLDGSSGTELSRLHIDHAAML
jgi:hypothetical protein